MFLSYLLRFKFLMLIFLISKFSNWFFFHIYKFLFHSVLTFTHRRHFMISMEKMWSKGQAEILIAHIASLDSHINFYYTYFAYKKIRSPKVKWNAKGVLWGAMSESGAKRVFWVFIILCMFSSYHDTHLWGNNPP